jgi:hypothetical protein
MKAKTRIKKVFIKSMENVSNGKQPNVSQSMRDMGYSESSCRALKVTQSKTWQSLSNMYLDDERALQTFYDLSGSDNEDKDNRLKASQEIMKLKNRYPKDNLSIDFNFKRKDLLIEDDAEDE